MGENYVISLDLKPIGHSWDCVVCNRKLLVRKYHAIRKHTLMKTKICHDLQNIESWSILKGVWCRHVDGGSTLQHPNLKHNCSRSCSHSSHSEETQVCLIVQLLQLYGSSYCSWFLCIIVRNVEFEGKNTIKWQQLLQDGRTHFAVCIITKVIL